MDVDPLKDSARKGVTLFDDLWSNDTIIQKKQNH